MSSGPILVLGDQDHVVADTLAGVDGFEHVGDLERCLARVTTLRDDGREPRLVALAPEVASPFTTGRRIRDVVPRVGLAYIVEPDRVVETETRLAFVPDLGEATVVASDPVHALAGRVARIASASVERGRVAAALAAMNRELSTPSRRQPVVRPGASERYLAALTRHAPDAIISTDRDGTVVASNAAAETLLGATGEPSEGRHIEDLLGPVDPQALRHLLDEVARGEAHDGMELAVRRGDGSDAVLSVTAAPVLDETGRVAGSVFLARDETEKRHTEQRLQLLQRSERLATLAGGVAHDFNNLLVTVQGWATLAAEDVTDTELVETALGHILTASDRAAELARAMLAYGGRVEARARPCDLTELMEGMGSLFTAGVPRKITVRLDLDRSLPRVDADPTQLRQVAMNLVTNAAEAIADAPGSIHVRTRAATPDDAPEVPTGHVVLEVEDSGPGMDADTARRVFDPFFTTKFAGRGLGLAASSGIVQAHGGTLTVRSEPGAGARFVVALPPRRGERP